MYAQVQNIHIEDLDKYIYRECGIRNCINLEHYHDSEGYVMRNMMTVKKLSRMGNYTNPQNGEMNGKAKLTNEAVLDIRSKKD